MRQISKEIYENGKYLKLSIKYKNYYDLKNAWDDRANRRKVPSIIINIGIQFSKINFDIDPLGGGDKFFIPKNQLIYTEIEKILLGFGLKLHSNDYLGKSGILNKIPNENVEELAEKIYDLLFLMINNVKNN